MTASVAFHESLLARAHIMLKLSIRVRCCRLWRLIGSLFINLPWSLQVACSREGRVSCAHIRVWDIWPNWACSDPAVLAQKNTAVSVGSSGLASFNSWQGCLWVVFARRARRHWESISEYLQSGLLSLVSQGRHQGSLSCLGQYSTNLCGRRFGLTLSKW